MASRPMSMERIYMTGTVFFSQPVLPSLFAIMIFRVMPLEEQLRRQRTLRNFIDTGFYGCRQQRVSQDTASITLTTYPSVPPLVGLYCPVAPRRFQMENPGLSPSLTNST